MVAQSSQVPFRRRTCTLARRKQSGIGELAYASRTSVARRMFYELTSRHEAPLTTVMQLLLYHAQDDSVRQPHRRGGAGGKHTGPEPSKSTLCLVHSACLISATER